MSRAPCLDNLEVSRIQLFPTVVSYARFNQYNHNNKEFGLIFILKLLARALGSSGKERQMQADRCLKSMFDNGERKKREGKTKIFYM